MNYPLQKQTVRFRPILAPKIVDASFKILDTIGRDYRRNDLRLEDLSDDERQYLGLWMQV